MTSSGELAAQLLWVKVVFGDFAVVEEEDRDVVGELGAEVGVGVNVHQAQVEGNLGPEGVELLFGLFAEVAVGAGVEGEFGHRKGDIVGGRGAKKQGGKEAEGQVG